MYPEDFENSPNCEYCRFGPGPGGPGFPPPPPGGPGGPGGFPGGPGGFPGGPGGPGFQGGPPMGPPPGRPPKKPQQSLQFVSPGSIRFCLYRYTYIWLRGGRDFWMWPTRVDRRSISGWRWNGRRWVYIGLDLRRIDYFQC